MSKVKIDIGQGVIIELTKEQLVERNRQQRKNIPVMERIKCFDDIIEESGMSKEYFDSPHLTESEKGLRACEAICNVLNEGWEADYLDRNQRKWFPVFETKPDSSFAFAASTYGHWTTYSYGGSRLCRLKSEELSDFAGKIFLDKFIQFLG